MEKLIILFLMTTILCIASALPVGESLSESKYSDKDAMLKALSNMLDEEGKNKWMSKRGHSGLWRFGKRSDELTSEEENEKFGSSNEMPAKLETLLLEYQLGRKLAELKEQNRIRDNYDSYYEM
ncbi:uncharacterized protein [Watersipora subatra]|uniref:uncharacterized protein n=1 Tax=Watersipora subatra TaxID=2589382 RepID=UPI00355ADFFD